jgi:transcription antitermination factor NusG
MTSAYEQAAWFAIKIKPRFERHVLLLLQNKGYETFLPLYQCRRQWTHRAKTLSLPLFPGYIFCRFDIRNRLPLLMTPGVFNVVGTGKTPVPVGTDEITAIERVIKSGVSVHPWPSLGVGQKVQIEYGPLRGLDGVILAVKRHYRLVISVTLLQRSIAVDLNPDWLSPTATAEITH